MAEKAARGDMVRCYCGWRGRRVWSAWRCECDWACSHSHYGACPKCGAGLDSVAHLRQRRIEDRKYEAWRNSDEGKAEMARVYAML